MNNNKKNVSTWVSVVAVAIAVVQLFCTSFGVSIEINVLAQIFAIVLSILVCLGVLNHNLPTKEDEETQNLFENITSSILDESKKYDDMFAIKTKKENEQDSNANPSKNIEQN